MSQEGRGIGLINKLKAYQVTGAGSGYRRCEYKARLQAGSRDYGIGAQILKDSGARKMKLLTNNPRKIKGLEGYGLEVVGSIPIQMERMRTIHVTCTRKKISFGTFAETLPKITK